MTKPRYRRHADGYTSLVTSDGLVSLATRLGTSSDKGESAVYSPRYLTDSDLEGAFRASWIIKKTVRVPALDATRRWRQWRGDSSEDIHRVEDRPEIQLRRRAYDALWMARLFGGAAILIGTDARSMEGPLDPDREELRKLTVLTRQHLSSGLVVDDATNQMFGLPSYYEISTTNRGILRIHPTRIVRFIGEPLPHFSMTSTHYGWGDSVLQSIYDACRNLDSTMGNIAALVFDAKTDIVKIPGLTENITNSRFEAALLERFNAARMLKGNHGTLILDAEEDYDSKSYNFGGLDTIADRFMQVASGAADIPMTRLLGMSPAGMNSTGESDLLNYYDRISSIQHTEMAPEMTLLDRMIVRAAGRDPEKETYIWSSLRQLTEQQKSESRHRAAQTIKLLAETMIYDDDQLAVIAHQMFSDLDLDVPREPGTDTEPPLTVQAPTGRPGPGPNTGNLA